MCKELPVILVNRVVDKKRIEKIFLHPSSHKFIDCTCQKQLYYRAFYCVPFAKKWRK
jgi:hypothetical protein